MQWKHLPIVAFDTETTGLSPFGEDRIIEFAAVVLRTDEAGHVVSQEDHAFLIDPQIPVPRIVTQLTGISDSDVQGKPTFAEHADAIRALLAGAITVAHNYPFDLAFLSESYKRLGQAFPVPLAEIDTVDLSMRSFPDARSHKLEDLCKRLDVSLVGAHRATNDAASCGRSFTELVRRNDVPNDLQEMLTWANAIGMPPEDAPFSADEQGRLVFLDGDHRGELVAEHPIHLAWMEKARVPGPNGWSWRFSASTRHWIRRWLDVRSSGRAQQNPKSFRAADWVIDSCIADPRREV